MALYLSDMPLYGLFVLTGVFSGFLSGLLSIGGAFVLVPALLAIFGSFYHFENHFMLQLTLGTTMACMIVSAISSTNAQNKRDSVYWKFLGTNWLYISIGTILGVILTNYFSATLIKLCFATFCIYSGYKMITRKKLTEIMINKVSAKIPTFFFGTICGFIGVGGANLFIPYLMKAEGIELKKAMGTASAIQIPVSIIGTVSYLVLGLLSSVPHAGVALGSGIPAPESAGAIGYIYVPAFLLVSVAGLFFNKVGVALAHKLPVAKLKVAFGCFTLLIGLKMAYGAL